MRDRRDILRRVAWKELFPVLTLWPCLRLAASVRMILLAFAAIGAIALGHWLVATLVGVPEPNANESALGQVIVVPETATCPWEQFAGLTPSTPQWDRPLDVLGPDGVVWMGRRLVADILPLTRYVQLSWRDAAYFGLNGLWTIGVFAFFGGCMMRTAAVRLARLENARFGTTVRFIGGRWLQFVGSALGPILAMVLIVLAVMLFGRVLLTWSVGTVIGGILWPIVLMLGIVLGLLGTGILFGWPLVWGAIAIDDSDGFSAVGSGFSYVFQRPLHLLFYVLVAAAFSRLGWYVAGNLAATVVYLTGHAAALGDPQLASVFFDRGAYPEAVGPAMLRFWTDCLRVLPAAYLLAYFWTASAQIYFLLRRSVDGAELDEMHVVEEEEVYDLPPIDFDEDGAAGTESEGHASAKTTETPSDSVAASDSADESAGE
ncbi:MAG: hypothetical protein D6741_15955 [Planctomycetota bacterium]|nr:MAG: hypothetical protein D6741_15955 [Planctomycetota bacterium]